MPLYIPWLTETIKKRGVRYLLHHYLGQFFEEKLTLEQLSIDIYEGKGSIRNLALDVDGLNDELDFIPFRFLEGCLIGQISVEVPWSSLATDACRVELDGAEFYCRLKTSSDATKPHCTESTLLSRSLMTSSMQMAEEIVTTEDDDNQSDCSMNHHQNLASNNKNASLSKRKDANQMFEGLEMFAQLIDSVLRRTKLTARNTLFQIKPHQDRDHEEDEDEDHHAHGGETTDKSETLKSRHVASPSRSSNDDEFSKPTAKCDSGSDSEGEENSHGHGHDDRENHKYSDNNNSKSTVEFFIKFFRCEEMIDQTRSENEFSAQSDESDPANKSACAIPETITKLLTLEDVEMRIDGIPVSNLVGKHTITIKFNGQKSEISVFSGSPLLAVIGRKQLETFFNVFDGAARDQGLDGSFMAADKDQKMMSPEDYAKIENQLLESASTRNIKPNDVRSGASCFGGGGMSGNSVISNNKSMSSNTYYASTMQGQVSIGGAIAGAIRGGARRWVDSGDLYYSDMDHHHNLNQAPPGSSASDCNDMKQSSTTTEPTLDHIEAFSCELKLPGIWLCILRDGEDLPPLIKPYADSINSFQSINKYIDGHIRAPHIRLLALKVALDLTAAGTNIFLGDLDISEHLEDQARMNPVLRLLHTDQVGTAPMSSSRYKASVSNCNHEITIDLLAKTRAMLDPTIIDRIVYDYNLVKGPQQKQHATSATNQRHQRSSGTDLNITIRAEQFKLELLCPIPNLTPDAFKERTQLRPQSFIFDFKDIDASWQAEKLKISSNSLVAYVKTQPMQGDHEAVKFIESTGKANNDKIVLQLEPSPSNLDNDFTNDIEQALNESSMYESIYISQTTESKIPTNFFQTKRKVVRASFQSQQTPNKPNSARISECDHEKILTPGDRQHLLDYLKQTVMSTRLSLDLHLPICELEFEDKEQLDLIYNRFANDFVFWQPRAFTKEKYRPKQRDKSRRRSKIRRCGSNQTNDDDKPPKFRPVHEDQDDQMSDADNEGSEVSYHSMGPHCDDSDEDEEDEDQDQHQEDDDTPDLVNCYDNEVTCKILVDELFVKFNHQSCAAKLKQDISAENFLLGVVIDVNKKPDTLLSMVADNLELNTDLETVLEGNTFAGKHSIFALTAEIKRPTKVLKDIKLAIQLKDGLFNDFRTETYRRFWQSINVTDQPILGYVAPQIVTELHIDVLNTGLLLVREGARPSLVSIDELYLTSMVMEQTSQVMIRLIADEVSLYMKRDRKGLETMKNYICLIDSGLIDLDVKFGDDSQLEFGVINNVITMRVCQDSLSELCRLFNVLIRSSNQSVAITNKLVSDSGEQTSEVVNNNQEPIDLKRYQQVDSQSNASGHTSNSVSDENPQRPQGRDREMNLLVDAMNDYTLSANNSPRKTNDQHNEPDCCTTAPDGKDYEQEQDPEISEESESDNEVPASRKTSECLLDQSNPMLGDLFSQPLMPMELHSPSNNQNHQLEDDVLPKTMDESGFFVIGDDDVGAGIIDKKQHDPVVRKLIDGPISIMENHFKMTRPRTIPEMLTSSIERYVLEEMTLVVNLYGGRDFDDEPVGSADDSASPTTTTNDPSTDQALEATNELLDSISSERKSIRSRAGSVAFTRHQNPSGSESISSSLKRNSSGKLSGARKKHLSEGSGRLDLGIGKTVEQRVRFGEGAVNLWESLDLMSAPDFLGTNRSGQGQPKLSSDLKQAGGTWRENDVCIQLTLSKVKLLYEVADPTVDRELSAGSTAAASSSIATTNPTPPISWRFMLFIQDIEVKDRIAASDINKMLYEYCNDSMPKRSTQMLTVKNIATINPSDGCEECDLRVSLKPLRLNIDQDTLLFLIEFCTNFCKSLTKQQSLYTAGPTSNRAAPLASGAATSKVITKPSPTVTRNSSFTSSASSFSGRVKVAANEDQPAGGRSRLDSCSSTISTSTATSDSSSYYAGTSATSTSSLSGAGRKRTASTNEQQRPANTATTTTTTTGTDAPLPIHCHTDNLAGLANHQQPIYIKSFTFSPDVPIRIDYHSKHLDFEQGALAGILMGLAHLDHSELMLRRVQAKHGMRGLDRVLVFAINSWLSDIKRNQLPSILGGVGPMHSVIQLFQGIRDLVWMPIDHYRKDGRLVRGLQRGASSFSSSTAMAAINLVNRFISIVQCTAQIAHDIVTPPTGSAQTGASSSRRRRTRTQAKGSCLGASSTAGESSSRRRHHYGHSTAPLPGHLDVGSRSLGSPGGGPSGLSHNSNTGLNQPRNFCEGVAVGFTIIKEGFNDTARNVTVGMQAEDMRSAVGELVRQIPSTLLNPIISATEGAQSVLVGIRNQIAPDARRDDQEKWKGRVRGN